MALAGSLLINPNQQFFDGDGDPLAGGFLYAYTAGTLSLLDTFSDSDLSVPNTNPIVLDADGRAGAVYLSPTGYKFILQDSAAVQIWSRDNVSDPSAVRLSELGVFLATGSEDVTSGYTITASDQFVTVDSTGGADPCLINLTAASVRTQPIAIANHGNIALAVTPNGADTINGIAGAFTVAASSVPNFPTVVLVPDGVSNYKVTSYSLIP